MEKQLGGDLKKVIELKDGTLLIEFTNEQQSNRIKDIKYLRNSNVMATEHKTHSSSKGTIRYRNFPNHTEEKIK